MIHFDATVSLGTLLTIGSILASASVLYSRLTALEVKMEPMWQWFTRYIHQREEGYLSRE